MFSERNLSYGNPQLIAVIPCIDCSFKQHKEFGCNENFYYRRIHFLFENSLSLL